MKTFFVSRIESFLFGLRMPLSALRLLIKTPSLLALAFFPVAIASALYGFVLIKLQAALTAGAKAYLVAWGLSPDGWALAATQVLLTVVLFFVGAVTFSIVTSVVASPFNDFLAERTERFATPPLPPVPGLFFTGKVRLLLIDLAKTGFAALAAVIALLVSWVPVLNLIAAIMTFLLIAFQYMSYPQTRREVGLLEGVRFLFRHFFSCLGFGASFSILFAIPIVSILCLPLAVIGGTLLFAAAEAGKASKSPLR